MKYDKDYDKMALKKCGEFDLVGKPTMLENLGGSLWRSENSTEIWGRGRNDIGEVEEKRVSRKLNAKVRWTYKCPTKISL